MSAATHDLLRYSQQRSQGTPPPPKENAEEGADPHLIIVLSLYCNLTPRPQIVIIYKPTKSLDEKKEVEETAFLKWGLKICARLLSKLLLNFLFKLS